MSFACRAPALDHVPPHTQDGGIRRGVGAAIGLMDTEEDGDVLFVKEEPGGSHVNSNAPPDVLPGTPDPDDQAPSMTAPQAPLAVAPVIDLCSSDDDATAGPTAELVEADVDLCHPASPAAVDLSPTADTHALPNPAHPHQPDEHPDDVGTEDGTVEFDLDAAVEAVRTEDPELFAILRDAGWYRKYGSDAFQLQHLFQHVVIIRQMSVISSHHLFHSLSIRCMPCLHMCVCPRTGSTKLLLCVQAEGRHACTWPDAE